MTEIEALKAERDALLAHNRELVLACKLAIDMFVANDCHVPNTIETLQDAIDATPQQCLRDVKAEAIDNATTYLADSIPDKSYECVIFKDRYVYISTRYLREYAATVRQGESGTWLKDSNVNGGKRQGGAE